MKTSTISALAMALTLGLVAEARAEDWTGLHLTFGLSGTSTNLRPDVLNATEGQSDRDFAPYAALGYDWAYGNLTLGVLADVDLAQVENDDLISQGKGLYGETDWFATLRGRVGMPLNEQTHIYASGGLALMRTGATGVQDSGTTVAASQTLKGAVVGLGAEYMLSPGRHLSFEYIYADFEQSDPYLDGSFVEGTFDPTVSALRVGYTWRF